MITLTNDRVVLPKIISRSLSKVTIVHKAVCKHSHTELNSIAFFVMIRYSYPVLRTMRVASDLITHVQMGV